MPLLPDKTLTFASRPPGCSSLHPTPQSGFEKKVTEPLLSWRNSPSQWSLSHGVYAWCHLMAGSKRWCLNPDIAQKWPEKSSHLQPFQEKGKKFGKEPKKRNPWSLQPISLLSKQEINKKKKLYKKCAYLTLQNMSQLQYYDIIMNKKRLSLLYKMALRYI